MRALLVALAISTAMLSMELLACHEPEREPPPVPPHPTDPANVAVTSHRASAATGPMLASALEVIDASILSDGSTGEAAPGRPDEAGVPMRAEVARSERVPPRSSSPTTPAATLLHSADEAAQ